MSKSVNNEHLTNGRKEATEIKQEIESIEESMDVDTQKPDKKRSKSNDDVKR